jgi:hypothetical protein
MSLLACGAASGTLRGAKVNVLLDGSTNCAIPPWSPCRDEPETFEHGLPQLADRAFDR